MNSTALIAAVAALIIGFSGGYMIRGNSATVMTHTLPNGSSMSDTMAGMTSGLAGKSGDDFDRAFLQEMIVHHEGAVEMAQQALQAAQHAEIKQMANDIISTQTQEISTMRGWLRSWYDVQ